MPLEQAFWGSRFGSQVDRFGIQWMVSQASPQDESLGSEDREKYKGEKNR